MRKARIVRMISMLASGSFLLQIGGCDPVSAFLFIDTILLGITAGGSIAILRNI